MLKNNKGFMLAEVAVTATVILTGLVALYATFTRTYNKYNERLTYMNIDGVYAIKGMVKNMIKTGDINGLTTVTSYPYKLIEGGSCIDSNDTYCSNLQSGYNIQYMAVIKYSDVDTTSGDKNQTLTNMKSEVSNQTFKDYIDYLQKYYNWTPNEDGEYEYSYLFIMEYKNEFGELNYSSMGVV